MVLRFIQSTGNYAMHLALNYKRKPLIGVVLIPEKDELWISYAEKLGVRKEMEVFKNKICLKQYSSRDTIVTSKNHRNQKLKDLIEKLILRKLS